MPSRLSPYLNFRDNTRSAMDFYKEVFGGNLTVSTFKEYNASPDPAEDGKIMHSVLEADNGMVLMASDTPNRMDYKPGTNISMSLSGSDEKELKGYWDKLSKGATIRMPLTKAAWGDTFGMLTDMFGIGWLVNIAAPKP